LVLCHSVEVDNIDSDIITLISQVKSLPFRFRLAT